MTVDSRDNWHSTAADRSDGNGYQQFLSINHRLISIIDTSRQIAQQARHTPVR